MVIAFELKSEEIRGKHVPVAGLQSHEGCDLFSVILKVGGKEKVSLRLQVAPHELHELAVDEASFAMTFFWPGIGAVDVERRQGVFLDMLCDKFPGLDPQDADVGDVMPLKTAAGAVAPFVVVVDGDKVTVFFICGRLYNEIADAAANFQGQWVVIAKNALPVWLYVEILFREEKR